MASYRVRRIVCEGYDKIAEELEAAIAAEVAGHEALVACLREPVHPSGVLHEVPDSTEGQDPYDEIWQRPVGPAFLLVIEAD